ncbi:MAG: ATP-dependent RNA helicase HrpA [Desulforegulaceae bacterium]|nr:ATP-dependent RNA helicase HrpA [Desulforegulaceae bacterium]
MTKKDILYKLYNKTDSLTTRDKIFIRKKIRKLQKDKTIVSEESIEKLKIDLKKAKLNLKKRKSLIPKPSFDENLPVNAKKEEIKEKIINNQVVIISGETGSGKTTQIPKICLEAGRGVKGKIALTQPRRIAAVSVAERISEELNEKSFKTIGYKIRFADKSNENTIIKVMTDGILLAETLTDRFLNSYDTIIVDEAHERSLNIDFILGFLLKLVKKRKDLKLIITSATIDTEKFSKAFGNAPVIEVSGRMFPVETIYLPPENEEEEDQDLSSLAANAFDLIKNEQNGDTLIFMPTENDILETIEKLRGRLDNKVNLMPLYARLPSHLQQKVFKPVSGQKVVVSTNVAETSITIPGIKYVIDTGLARIPSYLASSRTTSLPVSPVSKSSADQRKGRCGRVSNGICIRLFSEEDYENRPKFTLPEILRSNLADVLLKMTALKLGDIKNFPFIDRPETKNINDGYNLLTELGAIKESKQKGIFTLTELGGQMAKLPLDPKLSRMLIEASKRGCLEEVTAIVSGITAGDPRELPDEIRQKALQAQSVFSDPLSDFITFLNIWTKFNKESKKKLTTGAIGRFSKKYYLSFRRLKEWRDLYSQIESILEDEEIKNIKEKPPVSGDKNSKTGPLYEEIHKSILSGYLSNIAVHSEKKLFKAAKNKEVMIFPGSGLFKAPPDWIVCADIVETSRLFARTAGLIEPEWIDEVAGDLVKTIVYDPHYSKNQGRVLAYAQKTLYSLVILKDSKVPYHLFNKDEAGRIFYSQALYQNQVKDKLNFLEKNQKTINQIKDMEERLRKRDILVSENEIVDFYESKIPQVSDIRTLKNIIRKKGDAFLLMKKEDLMNYDPENEIKENFPDKLQVGEEKFNLKYKFNPGEDDDGVTISIPVNKTSNISASNIETVIPGLLKEKTEAVLKGLPKKYRTMLHPIKEKTEIILKEMDFSSNYFALSLSEFIKNRFKAIVPAKIISEVSIPEHLNMRIELTDIKGSKISASRNPLILKNIDRDSLPDSDEIKKFKKRFSKEDIKEFYTLENLVKVYPEKKNSPIFYPAFETSDGKIDLKLFSNKKDAQNAQTKSVKTFFEKILSTELKNLKNQIKLKTINPEIFKLFGNKENIEKGIFESVKNQVLLKPIRTEKEFYDYLKKIKDKKVLNFSTLEKKEKTELVLNEFNEVWTFLNNLKLKYSKTVLIYEMINDCIKSAKSIVTPNFFKIYSIEELSNIPRYLAAIKIRAERGISNPSKDSTKNNKVIRFQKKLGILLDELDESSSPEKRKETELFFWDIEEFKISVFAQELKTRYPVSEKKLEKKFSDIAKMI